MDNTKPTKTELAEILARLRNGDKNGYCSVCGRKMFVSSVVDRGEYNFFTGEWDRNIWFTKMCPIGAIPLIGILHDTRVFELTPKARLVDNW